MLKSRILSAVAMIVLLALNVRISSADRGGVVPNIHDVDIARLKAEMIANPAPRLEALPVDEKFIYARAYRRVLHATDIYDAANGKPVGHIVAGLNYVNGGRAVNGWVQIGRDQWLPVSAVGPMNNMVSKFSGVALPNGLPEHAFGWIVTTTQPSRTPGVEPDSDAPQIKRYTLVNLFALENVDSWNWYLIGPDQWVHGKADRAG
jgi:hypothetical protein